MALSWAALAWERAWRALWPALTLLGVGLAALVSGVLPRLPGWLHLAVLLALAGGVAALLLQAGRIWRCPTRAEAVSRLEGGAAPGHRPLTAARDTQMLGRDDALSRALWARHQADMRARAQALRPRPPRPGLAARDPRALRFVPLLLLFAALTMAWPDPLGRLVAGLSPRLGAPPPPAVAQVWITPPAYTGRAPLYIHAATDEGAPAAPPAGDAPAPRSGSAGPETPDAARQPVGPTPLVLPAGGSVLVLLRGGSGPGTLDLGAGQPERPLEITGDGGQRLDLTVSEGSRLRLTQDGAVLVDRPLHVVADLPPEVAWAAPPEGDDRGRLALSYRAVDDHGVTGVTLAVRAAGDQALGDPADLDLSVPPDGVGGVEAARDLSAHPWAGTAVALRLTAEDGAAQTGASEQIDVILPERRFSHPVAQAVVDLRRALVMRPDRAHAAAQGLLGLARDPAAYDDRLAVHLGLSTAAARLAFAPDGRARTEDLALLWSIALALEDGTLTVARDDLQAAREALREALERDAPREEIERRLADLREALDRMMRELAEAMPLLDMPPMDLPMPQGMEMVSPEDIQRMMDRLSDLTELGADEAAQAMLDQLERMLERLESARPPTRAEMEAMARANEMMQRLQELARRQRALLDETFRADPEAAERRQTPGLSLDRPFPDLPFPSMPPRPGGNDRAGDGQSPDPQRQSETARDLQERQRALREALEDLMADLGEMTDQVPEQLGEADMAMREAERALSEGDTGAAAQAQGRALEALTQGQGQAMGQMMGPGGPGGMGMMGLPLPGFGLQPGGPGMPGQMGPGFRPGPGRDPFNRPSGGVDDDSVDVPTEPDTRRAHEILRELRRRANEPERPAPEKDYLDRLMEPF
ncbi:TIGR02302 family protein [Roseospira navarrensis]|uniref:TIGR02302 family protein n=1 Tax=Roseospira navarrensis TaxID=140058 RepID=UPI001478AAF3